MGKKRAKTGLENRRGFNVITHQGCGVIRYATANISHWDDTTKHVGWVQR